MPIAAVQPGHCAGTVYNNCCSLPARGPSDISTNGTRSGAALVTLNTDIKGKISPVNDIDHYRFHISTAGTITITLTHCLPITTSTC
jgi:hypothetical protein